MFTTLDVKFNSLYKGHEQNFFYSAIYCLNYCTFLNIKGIEIELSLLSYTKKPKHNITITNKVQLYNYNSTK